MSTPISQFLTAPQPQANAGVAVALNNLLQLFPDGNVYPAQVSDYAATANTGNILAPTTLSNAYATTFPGGALAAQGLDGSYYVLAADGSSTTDGLTLTKYTALGVLVSSVVLDSSASNSCPQANVFILSNGNIGVVWSESSVGAKYAVYNVYLQAVQSVAVPTGGGTTYAANIVSCAITVGGFALFYGTAATTSSLTIYNNSGAQQATASLAATGSAVPSAIAQISNGNLALTYNTGSAHQVTIYNTSAVQQVAPFAGPTTAGGPACIASVSGYFALSSYVSSTQISYTVYSNAGAKQGSTLSFTALVQTYYAFPLVSDGTNFWAVYVTGSSPSTFNFTKITTAAVSTTYLGGTVTSLATSTFSLAYDGYGNLISTVCNFTNNASGSIYYTVFNINLLISLVAVTQVSTYYGAYTNAIAVGDGATLIVGASALSGTAAYQTIIKYVNTAILGAATIAAAINTPVTFDTTSGYKQITPLKGTFSKTFNNKTSSNVYGNAGTIISTAVTLQGM